MRTPFTALLVVLAATSALSRVVACSDEPVHERWSVAPYEVPCGEATRPRTCLLATDPEGRAHVLEQGIEGFTWHWGVAALLEVRVEHGAEGAAPRLLLARVVDETRVAPDARFELELGAAWLEGSAESGFRLARSRGIECASASVCEELDARLAAAEPETTLDLTLRYPDEPGAPLRLEHVGAQTLTSASGARADVE